LSIAAKLTASWLVFLFDGEYTCSLLLTTGNGRPGFWGMLEPMSKKKVKFKLYKVYPYSSQKLFKCQNNKSSVFRCQYTL
jgi:hypothetical protein